MVKGTDKGQDEIEREMNTYKSEDPKFNSSSSSAPMDHDGVRKNTNGGPMEVKMTKQKLIKT